MSTTLSKQDFHQHLEGTKATSGWDLLVSYDEEHLNRALAKKWKINNKGSGVKFNLHSQPTATIQIDQEFDLTLSPPSLKFSTSSKNAYLGMVLNGSYTTTVTLSGTKQPPETKSLPMNAYRLDVSLPISAVSGDGEVSPGDKVIHFDQADKHYSLIFHFKNTEARWHMAKNDDETHDIDDTMKTALTQIQAWFTSKDDIYWIDVSVAQLTNKANPNSDTDTLLPRSFVLSCQEGYLFVFIATKNPPGREDPQFGHKGSETIAPVPSGFTASIIIGHKLFTEFMKEELKKYYTGSLTEIKEEETSSGIQLSLAMTDSQSWNLNVPIGITTYDVDKVAVDYTKYPITLHVKDNESLASSVSLMWTAETKVWWYSCHKIDPATYTYGRVVITSNWTSPPKEFAHIVGDELQMQIDVPKTELPSMSFEGESVDKWWKIYKGVTDVPRFFEQQVQFTLPSNLSCQFKGLNFFSAQNVFVPGVRFIQATEQMVPHDVVLLGTMPEVEE